MYLLDDMLFQVTENVYECLASSSDCDTAEVNTLKTVRYSSMQQRRSDGSMDTSPDYVKFHGSFMRSSSLPYCGSETESDIYSPYSFYSSEDVSDILFCFLMQQKQCLICHIMPRFNSRAVHVGFVVYKVALGQVFVKHVKFSSVSIIPAMLHTHCSVTNAVHLTVSLNNALNNHCLVVVQQPNLGPRPPQC